MTHLVAPGETFWAIAREVGVTVAQLRAWNPGVDENALPVGYPLNVSAPVVEPEPEPEPPTEPTEDWSDEIAELQRDVDQLEARPLPVDYTSTLAALRSDLDRLKSSPAPEDYSDEIEAVLARIRALEGRPTGGASVSVPGLIAFDSLPGTDSARVAKMNEINKGEQQASGPIPSFVFGDRIVETTTPIDIRSSMSMESSTKAPAREYTRRPTIKWNGPRSSWLFRFLDPAKGEAQYGQGYPSDGSPRDGSIIGLQFTLAPGTHLIEPTATVAGRTLWYFTVKDIGVKDGASAWIGYGTGTVFMTGNSHFQAMTETVIDVGGSEVVLFGNEGISFGDTQVASNRALVRSKLEKSIIGSIMITGRKTLTPVELYGGRAVRVLGISPDSQGADPIYGSGIRITGGEGHIITGACIKGVGLDPSKAVGGAAANAGMIHISGGSQHVVMGSAFLGEGRNFPAVAVVGSATNVKVGLNSHVGFPGKARYVGGAGKYATFLPDSTAVLE